MIPPTIFTLAEQHLVCNWINANWEKGIYSRKRNAFENSSRNNILMIVPNIFYGNNASDNRFNDFLKLHPQFSEITCRKY